jgi:hypothetical protein
VAFASWLIVGSIIGRRVMLRKVRSYVANGGRLKLLSLLIEFIGGGDWVDEVLEYVGGSECHVEDKGGLKRSQ